MSSVIVSGDTSGSISITAPLVAGSGVLTLPVATDTLVGKATTDTLTNKTLTSPVLSGSLTGTYTLAGTPTAGASLITSGTSQASTSGTSIDFTSIPSWVKRITVMSNGVSTNGTSNQLMQIGSGSVLTSGYTGSCISGSGTAVYNSAGFIYNALINAADIRSGHTVLTNVSGNIWVQSGTSAPNQSTIPCLSGGTVTLSGTLDRVRITTVNGTDTFDAGSINILYE